MNINEIAKHIAKSEGLKKQVNIAQIKEIIGHVAELMASDADALLDIVQLGHKRVKKKK